MKYALSQSAYVNLGLVFVASRAVPNPNTSHCSLERLCKGFPNSVLGAPRGARLVICPSTTQPIQVINYSSSFAQLNLLCTAKKLNMHPLGSENRVWDMLVNANVFVTHTNMYGHNFDVLFCWLFYGAVPCILF